MAYAQLKIEQLRGSGPAAELRTKQILGAEGRATEKQKVHSK